MHLGYAHALVSQQNAHRFERRAALQELYRKRVAEAVTDRVGWSLLHLGRFEYLLEPRLQTTHNAFHISRASPEVARIRHSRGGFEDGNNRIGQDGIDGLAGLLRVEEKFPAPELVGRQRHGMRHPHSRVAHEKYQGLEP